MNGRILHQVIDRNVLEAQPEERGITIHNPNPKSIGYATTLTPSIIQQAIAKDMELLVTHHDAWEFMIDERMEAQELLAQNKISQIWCHEPLDKADFGTATELLIIIGCNVIGCIVNDCGRIGELQSEMELSTIIKVLSDRMLEKPCRIHDTGKSISRIAAVPGAGTMVGYLAEAL